MGKGCLKRKIKAVIVYIRWVKRLWHPNSKCAYLIGTPTHTNIGDSAIVVAEREFLCKCGYDKVIEVTIREYEIYRKCIVRLMPKHAIIFLPGGGNMGSLWPVEERWRRQIIEDFALHKIVVFPQTIYYSEDVDAIHLKDKSLSVYNTKRNLTIVARERKSFELMKQLYPDLNVLLTPDVVLSMEYQSFDVKRNGILICFRHDKEKELLLSDEEQMINELQKKGYTVKLTDTISNIEITTENRDAVVRKKLKEFASAQLVITDRLHGMIFSVITGTPCIAFGNNHHKVKGTYEWIESLEYIDFVENIEEAKEKIDELYKMENCVFHNDVSLFFDLVTFIGSINN